MIRALADFLANYRERKALAIDRKERRVRIRAMIEQAAARAKIEREVRQAKGWRSGWAR